MLNTQTTPAPRTSLTQKFAHLANQATANISGRGGPTPPPAVNLPPIHTDNLTQPTSPNELAAPNPRHSPEKPEDQLEHIVSMVYDKIRADPGKGLE